VNRDQFIDALQRELRDMDAGEQAEILADYAAYFRQAADAGRDDAEVTAALGTPRQLADALKQVARVRLAGWQTPTATIGTDRVSSLLGVLVGGLAWAFGFLLKAALLLAFTLAGMACVVAGALLLLIDVPELKLQHMITLDIAGHNVSNPDMMMLAGAAMVLGGLLWIYIDVRLLRNLGRRVIDRLNALAQALRTR
jgi:uncharacterized membrane protein